MWHMETKCKNRNVFYTHCGKRRLPEQKKKKKELVHKKERFGFCNKHKIQTQQVILLF